MFSDAEEKAIEALQKSNEMSKQEITRVHVAETLVVSKKHFVGVDVIEKPPSPEVSARDYGFETPGRSNETSPEYNGGAVYKELNPLFITKDAQDPCAVVTTEDAQKARESCDLFGIHTKNTKEIARQLCSNVLPDEETPKKKAPEPSDDTSSDTSRDESSDYTLNLNIIASGTALLDKLGIIPQDISSWLYLIDENLLFWVEPLARLLSDIWSCESILRKHKYVRPTFLACRNYVEGQEYKPTKYWQSDMGTCVLLTFEKLYVFLKTENIMERLENLPLPIQRCNDLEEEIAELYAQVVNKFGYDHFAVTTAKMLHFENIKTNETEVPEAIDVNSFTFEFVHAEIDEAHAKSLSWVHRYLIFINLVHHLPAGKEFIDHMWSVVANTFKTEEEIADCKESVRQMTFTWAVDPELFCEDALKHLQKKKQLKRLRYVIHYMKCLCLDKTLSMESIDANKALIAHIETMLVKVSNCVVYIGVLYDILVRPTSYRRLTSYRIKVVEAKAPDGYLVQTEDKEHLCLVGIGDHRGATEHHAHQDRNDVDVQRYHAATIFRQRKKSTIKSWPIKGAKAYSFPTPAKIKTKKNGKLLKVLPKFVPATPIVETANPHQTPLPLGDLNFRERCEVFHPGPPEVLQQLPRCLSPSYLKSSTLVLYTQGTVPALKVTLKPGCTPHDKRLVIEFWNLHFRICKEAIDKGICQKNQFGCMLEWVNASGQIPSPSIATMQALTCNPSPPESVNVMLLWMKVSLRNIDNAKSGSTIVPLYLSAKPSVKTPRSTKSSGVCIVCEEEECKEELPCLVCEQIEKRSDQMDAAYANQYKHAESIAERIKLLAEAEKEYHVPFVNMTKNAAVRMLAQIHHVEVFKKPDKR